MNTLFKTGYMGIEIFALVFILTMILGGILLPILRRRHACQYILEIGPRWHKSKEGTPTMGGLAPLLATLSGTLIIIFSLRGNLSFRELRPFLFTLGFSVANAAVGAFDDLTKLAKRQNAGLTPWQKLVLQIAFATAYVIILAIYEEIPHTLPIPFTSYSVPIGWWFYPIAVITLVWFVNCANLTDGIDGLASSVGTVIGIMFMVVAIRTSSSSLILCSAALVGGAFGFFLFNKHPAKVFMGDTGSLFFGALAVGCSFISASPLIFILAGIIYTIEGLSVVLQVAYFKLTKGKRLFRMAPFHHHLEKSGWNEWQIVFLFVGITIFSCLLSLLELL